MSETHPPHPHKIEFTLSCLFHESTEFKVAEDYGIILSCWMLKIYILWLDIYARCACKYIMTCQQSLSAAKKKISAVYKSHALN